MNPAATKLCRLDLVLSPARSLPPSGFRWLMAIMGGLSLAIGLMFLAQGAWPVFGFFGLDVLLLYGAFKANDRAGRVRERLRLLDEAVLEVTRRLPSGRAQRWVFNAYWVRVELETKPWTPPRLALASHGRRLEIGAFLPPDEKTEIAGILRAALGRLAHSPSTSSML